jgi:hypothetical protein
LPIRRDQIIEDVFDKDPFTLCQGKQRALLDNPNPGTRADVLELHLTLTSS